MGLMKISKIAQQPPPSPLPVDTIVVTSDGKYAIYISGEKKYESDKLSKIIKEIRKYDVNLQIPRKNVTIINKVLRTSNNLDNISFKTFHVTDIDFRKVGKIIYFDDFSSNFLNANVYTRYDTLSPSTVTFQNGVIRFSAGSGYYETIFAVGRFPPVFIAELKVTSMSVTTAASAIVSLIKDTNNYVSILYARNVSQGFARFEIYVKKDGTGTLAWTYNIDIQPPFSIIVLFVLGTIHILYEKDYRISYVGKYAVADFDFRAPGIYDDFRIGFGAHTNNSTVEIDKFAVYISALGVRDPYPVTLTDGVTPVLEKGKYLISATAAANDAKDSYMLLFTYDPVLNEFKVRSLILNIINGKYYTDHAGQILYDIDNDEFIVFNSSWSSTGYGVYNVVFIHFFKVKSLTDIIQGEATRIITTEEAFDPAVLYDESAGKWYIFFQYGAPGSRSLAIMSNTTLSATGWTIEYRRAQTTTIAEGTHYATVGGLLYATWGDTARYPDMMRYSRFKVPLDDYAIQCIPPISTAGANPPHPLIIPIFDCGTTRYRLITFTQSTAPAGTMGTMYIYESDSINIGYETPVVMLL
ncbi:MAG: hypothetical protein QW320_09825 [Ignisphaera sp.]